MRNRNILRDDFALKAACANRATGHTFKDNNGVSIQCKRKIAHTSANQGMHQNVIIEQSVMKMFRYFDEAFFARQYIKILYC